MLVPRKITKAEIALATLHETRVLPCHHTTVLDGVPVVTPSRLLAELAADLHADRVERACDTLWARRLVDATHLDEALATLARRGRRGTTTMRRLVEARRGAYRPPESGVEARAEQLLVQAGITGFERQVDVGGDGWVARVDFLHRPHAVALFVDSDRFHAALLDRAHDLAQTDALVRAGFVVVRVRAFDIWHRPWHFIAQVRAAHPASATTTPNPTVLAPRTVRNPHRSRGQNQGGVAREVTGVTGGDGSRGTLTSGRNRRSPAARRWPPPGHRP